ncbi:MAG: hypothetical protein Q9209_003171 [Squamulea sp. 1 TL-2023]
MRTSTPLSFSFLCLFLFKQTLQVNVILSGSLWTLANILGHQQFWAGGCINLPPGECCAAPPSLILDPGVVYFTDLQNLDIAFLWKERRVSWWFAPMRIAHSCSGIPFRSKLGGPSWRYHWFGLDQADSTRAAGASYIRLPPKVPPDPNEVNWLGVEGMKGLVWGGGHWFANQAGYPRGVSGFMVQRQNYEPPGPQISRSRSVLRGGNFYATMPSKGRYIDWVTINGTNYTHNGEGDLFYTNAAGRVLDLNATAT